MKWLQGNPLGMALVAISGFLALLALVMAIVWSLPVAEESAGPDTENTVGNDSTLVASKVGSLNDYRVINEKPVFNESRTPVIEEDDEAPVDEVDASIAVTDAPDVKLTGVVITPGKKIASLTPADAEQESIMAHEGESLTGEFVGWQVSLVHPRSVVLESKDGQKLELELQVHDVTIKEPPKPKPAPVAKTAQTQPGQTESVAGDGEEPLSRAEQIRQRIAERREELRREQEEKAAQENSAASQPANAYQNSIRARIRNNPKDKASNDKEDG